METIATTVTDGARAAAPRTAADVALCGALAAGTVVYFVLLPRSLGFTDEGLYLYEAKRLLEGDIFYRDIFEIITPGAHYLMALMFWIFGTTVTTAKVTAAVVHGLTTAVTYATGRALGLRRGLALLPALAYPALCTPAWPVASPHWITTALSMLLLLTALRRSWVVRPPRTMLLGLLVGLMIAVMQQKGVIMGAGIVVVLIKHHFIDRRYGQGRPLRVLGAQLGYLAIGTLLVVAPLVLAMTASAGIAPAWRAIIEHPLTHYKSVNQSGWGNVQIMTSGLAAFTFPTLLKYLPIALVIELVRTLLHWLRRTQLDEVRGLTTIIVFGIFSAVSIAYLPDFIHVSFIAPIFFVAAAECLDWALTGIDQRVHLGAALPTAVVVILALGLGWQLQQNYVRMHTMYSVPADTAFGRVDFPGPKELEIVTLTNQLLGDQPNRELFSYPVYPALYLTTGARNPTPYQILIRRYNFEDQFEETIATLEQRRVPVVFLFTPFIHNDDPILAYVRDHYVPAGGLDGLWKRPAATN